MCLAVKKSFVWFVSLHTNANVAMYFHIHSFAVFHTDSTFTTFKAEKSKRRIVGFRGKVLTDKKLPPLILGQFSFQPIIFFVFVFSFSLFQWIWSENAVGGGRGVTLVNSLPKVHSKVC
jgi:hypothetical protein